MSETIVLANGARVPKSCVDALDDLDKLWPGATFSHARPAIVLAVLKQYLRLVKNNKGAEVSADNGYILRKQADGKLIIHMYSASADAYPLISSPGQVFNTLEEAIEAYELGQDDEYWSEYGLTIRLKE